MCCKRSLVTCTARNTESQNHCEEFNSALDLFHEYRKDALIQREINMIIEAAHNTIGRIEDLINENNKIVDSCKIKLIESQLNMGQVNYGYCINYGCQNN